MIQDYKVYHNMLFRKEVLIPVNLLPQDQNLKPPQPIILDPTLKFPLSARLLQVWNEFSHTHPSDRGDSIVRQPWVICGDKVDEGRIAEVEEAGAVVIRVQLDTAGKQATPFRSASI